MEKSWLIRTSRNQILGPVSKNKIKKLIQEGTIKADDEICSGNGYWIYIKEQELVAKYIFDDNKQDFNPVQEAKTVAVYKDKDSAHVQVPAQEDLEYPSGESHNENSDITQVSLNLADLKKELELDEEQSDEAPDFNLTDDESSIPEVKEPVKVKFNSRKRLTTETIRKTKKNKTILSVKVLYVLIVLFFMVAVSALYFRESLIKRIVSSAFLIESSHAQSFAPIKKKV